MSRLGRRAMLSKISRFDFVHSITSSKVRELPRAAARFAAGPGCGDFGFDPLFPNRPGAVGLLQTVLNG